MSDKKARDRQDLKLNKADGIVPQNLRKKLAIADFVVLPTPQN
jgi:hypothetical protein